MSYESGEEIKQAAPSGLRQLTPALTRLYQLSNHKAAPRIKNLITEIEILLKNGAKPTVKDTILLLNSLSIITLANPTNIALLICDLLQKFSLDDNPNEALFNEANAALIALGEDYNPRGFIALCKIIEQSNAPELLDATQEIRTDYKHVTKMRLDAKQTDINFLIASCIIIPPIGMHGIKNFIQHLVLEHSLRSLDDLPQNDIIRGPNP